MMGFGDAESLKKARREKKRLREQGIKFPSNPEERFQQTKHPLGSKPYMRLAIAANCYGCVGRERSFRRLISECDLESCSFHELRPYKPTFNGNT